MSLVEETSSNIAVGSHMHGDQCVLALTLRAASRSLQLLNDERRMKENSENAGPQSTACRVAISYADVNYWYATRFTVRSLASLYPVDATSGSANRHPGLVGVALGYQLLG